MGFYAAAFSAAGTMWLFINPERTFYKDELSPVSRESEAKNQ